VTVPGTSVVDVPNRHLTRVLSPDYLDGLPEWSDDEVRARRAECHDLEEAASYLRRLTQTHLDIIGAELDSRRRGDTTDMTVVERLTRVLSSTREASPGARGRLVSDNPRDDQEAWAEGRARTALGGHAIESIGGLDDAALAVLTESLIQLERDVSSERRRLHEIYDAIQGELVQRYKTGRSSVDRLLR
jgi:hypothetical protein